PEVGQRQLAPRPNRTYRTDRTHRTDKTDTPKGWPASARSSPLPDPTAPTGPIGPTRLTPPKVGPRQLVPRPYRTYRTHRTCRTPPTALSHPPKHWPASARSSPPPDPTAPTGPLGPTRLTLPKVGPRQLVPRPYRTYRTHRTCRT